MIRIYTQIEQGEKWSTRYRGCLPVFACVLGFTETALIPGISAAGRTPEDRKYTAFADAEFLYYGLTKKPTYPLPPLEAGVSPVLISRAVVEALQIPFFLFNAGLPQPLSVPAIDLGGTPAKCLSQGQAMELATVRHLLEQGLVWGERLGKKLQNSYLIIGECVVGGTTTALAILTALGIPALGKVNSSHPSCNHMQKWTVVQAGLEKGGMGHRGGGAGEQGGGGELGGVSTDSGLEVSPNETNFTARHESSVSPTPYFQVRKVGDEELEDTTPQSPTPLATTEGTSATQWLLPTPLSIDPLEVVAAVGDPMQVVVAGMAIAATRHCGVLLAGGTQMLAVYALMSTIAKAYALSWRPEELVVGTTRWVAEDPTGGTVELAQLVGKSNGFSDGFLPPLLATGLSFANSRYSPLQAYEQGFVKEGMGAGGLCIAAHLRQDWQQNHFLKVIENLLERFSQIY
jgi:NaMN:DMB phosphoribosyltransferase